MSTRTLLILAVSAALGACAGNNTPQQAGNWAYPGEQVAVVPQRPLMRLATLPMNPAPVPALEDYTEEPTRFLFRTRLIFFDENGEAVDDSGDMMADSGDGSE